MKPGRKVDPRRDDVIEKFGLGRMRRIDHKIPPELLDQIDACADDEARRLILGVSR